MLMQDGGNMLSAPDQNETVEFGADLSSVLSPSLRAFADVWQKSRTGDGFPSRQDLNPAEFPRLLPHLYIMDRDQPPVHWRYRLAGAEIHQSLQQVSLKGRGLNEVLPENALPLVSRRWSPVADAGSGVYMSGPSIGMRTVSASARGCCCHFPICGTAPLPGWSAFPCRIVSRSAFLARNPRIAHIDL